MKRHHPIWPILALLGAVCYPSTGHSTETFKPMVGIVHLHSTYSSGLLSLEEIALQAESMGIEVALMAENYHLEFTYGPPPLPELFRLSRTFPSLTHSSVAGYLRAVDGVNRRHPRVILIPGVEVVPHYYWTGTPWGGDLTMHDGQKNILVSGLGRPEDYQNLPITSNPRAGRYNARSLLRALPLLLVVAGLAVLATKRERRFRIGAFRVSERRRPWKAALSLLLVGGAWSAYNAPFSVPAHSTAGPEAGPAPYQALIDYVGRRGGVTIWSYPEARDYHEHRLPLMPRTRRFITRTDPHPEALLGTRGYTAFGAVYQDTTAAEKPGRTWDEALEQFCTGQREKPPWGVGELGFHGADQKSLGDVLTVFSVRETTAQGTLEALTSGRMYALIPSSEARLTLEEFVLTTTGGREARMGDTLGVGPGEALTLRLALHAQDGASHAFQAVVVRNGKAWKELEGVTPFSTVLEDVPGPDRHCTYYRLWMQRPHRLISNPVFAASPREISD